MIENLIRLLVVALVLALIYYVCQIFIAGIFLQIVGAILILIFILYVLRTFGIGI